MDLVTAGFGLLTPIGCHSRRLPLLPHSRPSGCVRIVAQGPEEAGGKSSTFSRRRPAVPAKVFDKAARGVDGSGVPARWLSRPRNPLAAPRPPRRRRRRPVTDLLLHREDELFDNSSDPGQPGGVATLEVLLRGASVGEVEALGRWDRCRRRVLTCFGFMCVPTVRFNLILAP